MHIHTHEHIGLHTLTNAQHKHSHRWTYTLSHYRLIHIPKYIKCTRGPKLIIVHTFHPCGPIPLPLLRPKLQELIELIYKEVLVMTQSNIYAACMVPVIVKCFNYLDIYFYFQHNIIIIFSPYHTYKKIFSLRTTNRLKAIFGKALQSIW